MARAALALPFAGLHGSLGNTRIIQRPDGPEVRARVYRPRVPSPAQAAGAERLRTVGEAWRALDDATFAAWQAFARGSAWRNPASGAVVVPQAYRLFSGLASRALMVDPGRSLAGFMPPARAFLGDGVVLEVSPSPERAIGRGGRGERREGLPGPLPPPPRQDEPLGEGAPEGPGVTFAADRANAPGVVTELLAQPLANARRAVYEDKYASAGFVAFEGAETFALPLAPGAWAVAYRFVLAATGQETALVALGVVVVA